MSVAEKLVTVARNNKQIVDGYDQIVAASYNNGKQEEYGRFWDTFQQNGQREDYTYAFQFWDASIFQPKYDIVLGSGNYATGMFSYFNKADANAEPADLVALLGGKKLDTSKSTAVANMFNYANVSHLPELDFSNATQTTTPFQWCTNLHTIDKVILKDDGSQNIGAICNWCTNLVEIRFEGTIGSNVSFSHSSKLSEESVDSIVDALMINEHSALDLTLTLHSNVISRLTDQQLYIISHKNWKM